MEFVPFQVPHARHLVRHAFPRILEGTIIPVGLFIIALHFTGVTGAVAAGLVDLLRHRGAAPDEAPRARHPHARRGDPHRPVGAHLRHRQHVRVLPPADTRDGARRVPLPVSVPTGRPLVQRLASDFCPIPAPMFDTPRSADLPAAHAAVGRGSSPRRAHLLPPPQPIGRRLRRDPHDRSLTITGSRSPSRRRGSCGRCAARASWPRAAPPSSSHRHR